MSQNYTAWPVPQDIKDTLTSTSITLRTGVADSYLTAKIAAVTQKLQQITHRQFLQGSLGEVRYFDGSGTGTQTIDEFISFTDIQILGYLGTAGINLTNCVTYARNTYPNTKILIYRGSLPGIGRIWLDNFPGGRQNIQVTGTWGYGPYIPDDIWEAVRLMAAAYVAEESMFDQKGRIQRWLELDTSEIRDLNLPGEALGWYRNFRQTCYLYRKSLQVRLELGRGRMI